MAGASAQEHAIVDSTSGVVLVADSVVKTEKDTLLTKPGMMPVGKDTVSTKKKFEPNPKKAGMYSSIIPGMGQLYNRQYWKVPLVYAILGTAGYFIGYNYSQYTEYRQAYIYAIDGDSRTNVERYALYQAEDLKRLQAQARKDLDILVLLTSVGYALQIMDAVSSAHLKNFDISRDISLKVRPVIQNNFAGMGLVMNFH